MEPSGRADDDRMPDRELRQYRTLVETAGDPMFVLDEEGYLEVVNDAMVEFTTESSKASVLDRHVSDVTTEEGFRKGTEALRELLREDAEDGGWTSYEIWDRSPRGEERYYEVRIGVIRDEEGAFVGSVGTVRDITERKKREKDLALLKQVLTRILRHNVRNELTVIEGHAESLAAPAFDGDRQAVGEAILERAGALRAVSEKAGVVENIVDSRGERVRHELPNLLSRAIEAVESDHPDASIERSVPSTGAVRGIPELRVAVVNLLENAVVHGGDRVRLTVEHPEPNVVTIVVADDGPGIPAEELAVLDAGEETELAHGSGVGLWLAQWAVERSGGELRFDTDVGTRAELRLPPDQGPGTPALGAAPGDVSN